MDPTSPLPAIAALALCVATGLLIVKKFPAPTIQGRLTSIDGLRGYLAFFVFLHHAVIWYFYLRSGAWTFPPSNLYTHFGQSGVAFFFMITGFLFFSKVIRSDAGEIDWLRLFVSRLLRLGPLYLVVMLMMFLVVLLMSHGDLYDSPLRLLKQVIQWLSFTILGSPDINSLDRTRIIVAGVIWSLPYEWFFYLSLPVLAWALQARPPRIYLMLSALSVVAFIAWRPAFYHLIWFGSGMLAAVLVRYEIFSHFARGRGASLIIVACVALTVAGSPTSYAPLPVLLLSAAFALIAGGNTLFGVLSNAVSRTLGEFAYSIYLLHGMLLFVVFTFVIGPAQAREMSPAMHWAIILGITPLLLIMSFASFRFIESPPMQRSRQGAEWLRKMMARVGLRTKILPSD